MIGKGSPALTTIDNPFDPFDDFMQWFMYDVGNGYNTCGLLARFAHPTNRLSEKEYDEEIEHAIDEIIKFDPLGMYKKVYVKQSKAVG